MSGYKPLFSRVRALANRRGAHDITVQMSDGSARAVHLTCRNDSLKVLIAAFEISRRAALPPDKQPAIGATNPRATAIANLIADSERVLPDRPLWGLVRGLVRQGRQQKEQSLNAPTVHDSANRPDCVG
jgi:hypothetical protein